MSLSRTALAVLLIVCTSVFAQPGGQEAQAPPKLGLKPEPAGKVKVKAQWRNGTPPATPDKVDHFAGWKFDMGRNTEFGTCGPTSVSNAKRMSDWFLFNKATITSFDDLADLYRRSGNPRFNPNIPGGVEDNGVIMSDLLEASADRAFGDRVIAYASLGDLSDPSLYAAIDRFGGLLLAVGLQTAQQRQTDQGFWDYQRSGNWGGHAILAGKFDKITGRIHVVTWQKDVWTTPAFRRYQLQEAWLPIWESAWKSGKYWTAGMDTAAFARDWEAVTGKVLPPMPKQDPVNPPVNPPVDPPVGPGKGYTGEISVTLKFVDGKLVSTAGREAVAGAVRNEFQKAFPNTISIGGRSLDVLSEKIADAVITLKP